MYNNFPDIGKALMFLFWWAVIASVFGTWKLIEIIIWIIQNVGITIGG